MKICPNCKVEYDDLENFCVRCGKKLERETVTLDSMNERLRVMEDNLTRLSKRPPLAGEEAGPFVPGIERRLEELRLSLIEKINHNTDAIERLAERVKELDGMSEEGRQRTRETVQRIISEEAKNIGQGTILDLRKRLQDISNRSDALASEVGELRKELESFRNELSQTESRVAKNIYKELTKSLVT